jgi:hygromycin-B 7''-O-kinase
VSVPASCKVTRMKRHRTLDVAEAQRYVTGNVTSVNRLDGAGISDVFEVVTDERSVVVKLFPPDYVWKLAKELFVYRLVEEHAVEVPVPRVISADHDQHVLVLERIDGVPTNNLADDDVPRLYCELGRLLARLHAIELEAFGYLTAEGVVEPHATNLDYMRSQFAKRLASFTELGGDPALGDAIANHVRAREELLAGGPTAVFCHNDCHEGNVLVTRKANGTVAGVFDFENALAGDPLLDLAKTVAYSPRDRSVITDAIADGYENLSAGWRDGLDLYGLYHVLELWGWFASLGERDHLNELADDLAERIS